MIIIDIFSLILLEKCISGLCYAQYMHLIVLKQMYEGSPNKSCTFFITQDQIVGIIWNLYDLYIYISQISSNNLNKK